MAYDLSAINTTSKEIPPRILIYGPPGLGKTSLAAEFRDPVIIDIEQGLPSDVSIPSMGEIDSYQNVIDRITALINDEHDFKTLIIDSLDRLEPLVWAHVCKENNWQSIEEPGYGKGYIMASDAWGFLIRGLNTLRKKRNMTILLIGHSTIDRFDDPQSAPYSRYDIRLHKRANALFQDEVDAILFVNKDVSVVSEDVGFNKTARRAEGGDFRWIFTEGRPAYTAKNRYGLPPRIKYDKGSGYDQLLPYLPAQGDPETTASNDDEAKKEAA